MTWKTQKEICAIAENSDWWTFNRCTFLTCAHPGRHGCVQTWVCRGDGRWSPPERPWDGTPAEGSCDSPRGTDAPLAGGSRSWRSERASGPAPYHTPRWTAWTAEGRNTHEHSYCRSRTHRCITPHHLWERHQNRRGRTQAAAGTSSHQLQILKPNERASLQTVKWS